MANSLSRPLESSPDDIEAQLEQLLHAPRDRAIGAWLLELIKGSGHLSSSDDLRWRAFCMVWLAFEYDVDQAWPYLMWLNMAEPTISAHLSEILSEAIDDFEAHVKVANWLNDATDERLVIFFQDFRIVPARRKIQPLITRLMVEPTAPETGVWLATFCRNTVDEAHDDMRSWRLLTAAWYAAYFNPTDGLKHLHALTNGSQVLSQADNELLTITANRVGGLSPMIQLIADCPEPAVKTMLKDFGHPDLPRLAESILQNPPDYSHLADSAAQASLDAESFYRNLACLEEGGFSAKTAKILDLACGPLAAQTLLLSSIGYETLGADLHIPPGYMPLAGAKQWWRRKQHTRAWKAVTQSYYRSLAEQVNVALKWNRVKVRLADLTRLDLADISFDAAVCVNYLQHAANVEGLLAEAARVLRPDGLFLADIWPYAALHGAFQYDAKLPWSHLRGNEPLPAEPLYSLNKWREAQFRAIFDGYFRVEQWLLETDEVAQAQLTAEIRAELAEYSEDELTTRRIVIVVRKQ
jgi:SAM-dependent methyltransferase